MPVAPPSGHWCAALLRTSVTVGVTDPEQSTVLRKSPELPVVCSSPSSEDFLLNQLNESFNQHILCGNISGNLWYDFVLLTWNKSSQTSFSLDASEADGSPAWCFSLAWRSSQQRHLQDMRKTACLTIAVEPMQTIDPYLGFLWKQLKCPTVFEGQEN